MRPIVLLCALALLAGCKSSRSVISESSLTTDSVASTAQSRTSATLDSMQRSIFFDFDTVKVQVEHPDEVIRLTAIRGRVVQRQSAKRLDVVDTARHDTVAYHSSAGGSTTEHSAATQAYSPPNGTTIFIAILLILFLVFLYLRSHK